MLLSCPAKKVTKECGIGEALRKCALPYVPHQPHRRPVSKNVPIFGRLHLKNLEITPCRYPIIGTFSGIGWRSGGWILKEGAFARSASLSRLLLVLFLATQEKYIRSPHVQKGIPFCKLHKSNLVLFL